MTSRFYLFACSLALISSLFVLITSADSKYGFTVDLIHRDSPKSPFYDPTIGSMKRLRNAISRSVNRVQNFRPNKLSPNSPKSDLISSGGEYLMNISLGTPAFPVMAIADTGSDLTWTQCKPCEDCYKQEAPIFDPKRSSTYKNVSCSSNACPAVGATLCKSNTCLYRVLYADFSHSFGDLAVDTLTLGSTDQPPVALKNILIGCGHDNGLNFNKKVSGIVGLGGGPVSLISQLGDSIEGKFSYCLVPISSKGDGTGKLNFGSNAVVSGTGVVSTPLVSKSPNTAYYLTLEGVTVGSEKIELSSSKSRANKGNIIIDSGTTLTWLPFDFYSEVEKVVAASIKAKRVEDPSKALSLCYQATSDLQFPVITMNFDGADVKLDSSNVFMHVSEDVVCFTFIRNKFKKVFGIDLDFGIFGNIAQSNFLVGYDTVSKMVSFKQTDCSKM